MHNITNRDWFHASCMAGGISEQVIGLQQGGNNDAYGYEIGLGAYYFVVFCEWIHQVMKGNAQQYEIVWLGPVCYIRPIRNQIKKE